MKKTHKEQLFHAAWDTQNERYAQRPVDFDPLKVSQMVADAFCPGPTYLYILDVGTREFDYVSPEAEQILGLEMSAHTVGRTIDMLHPASAEFMVKCEAKVVDFLFEKIVLEKILKYKFVYNIRIKKLNNGYGHFIHQAMALTQDSFGRMSKVLGIHTDISHLNLPDSQCMSIIGLQGEPSYLNIDPSLPNDRYLVPPRHHFTERELEVIRLFADGLTASGVAERLGLSVGTVRTHRKNILQKSDCPNMTAVVAKCIREGLV